MKLATPSPAGATVASELVTWYLLCIVAVTLPFFSACFKQQGVKFIFVRIRFVRLELKSCFRVVIIHQGHTIFCKFRNGCIVEHVLLLILDANKNSSSATDLR